MFATISDPRGWARPLGAAGGRALDVALAVVSFVAFTGPVSAGWVSGHGAPLAATLFGAAAAGCLLTRRGLPVLTLVAVAAVEVAALLAGVRFTPFVSNAGPVVAIAVFTVADRRPRRVALCWSIVAVLAMSVAALAAKHLYSDQDQDVVQLLVAVPAALLGDATRSHRAQRRRAAQDARLREREHDARVRAEERLRISREVHDVVPHTLSMIAVRSGVARLLIDTDAVEARTALGAIETASRTALGELRAVLRSTRDAPATTPDDDPVEGPALARLDRLVDTSRGAGLTVSIQVSGTARHYAPMLETSAYRVVQEALTNVVKHAPASRVRIEIGHNRGQLMLSVVNDSPGPRPAPSAGPGSDGPGPQLGSGFGLAGMRERLELFDGTLEAGPRPDGGFAVLARFPTSDHPARTTGGVPATRINKSSRDSAGSAW